MQEQQEDNSSIQINLFVFVQLRQKSSKVSSFERQLAEKTSDYSAHTARLRELEEELQTKTNKLGELQGSLDIKENSVKEANALVDKVKMLHVEQCKELEQQIEEVR